MNMRSGATSSIILVLIALVVAQLVTREGMCANVRAMGSIRFPEVCFSNAVLDDVAAFITAASVEYDE